MEIRVSLHALKQPTDAKQAAMDAEIMPAYNALKLGTKRSSYIGTKGDLTCFLTDVDLPARKKEPAMLLAAKSDPTNRHVHILLSELWILCDPATPADAKRQQFAIRAMCERLYGFVTQQDCYRVLDAVYDFAQDLQQAKPPRGYSLQEWMQALADDDMSFTFGGEVVNR